MFIRVVMVVAPWLITRNTTRMARKIRIKLYLCQISLAHAAALFFSFMVCTSYPSSARTAEALVARSITRSSVISLRSSTACTCPW